MPLLEQLLTEMRAEEAGSTGDDCRRHELRRIAGASDRPFDSYERLTRCSILVDKRVSGSDAGLMPIAVVLALGIIALFIVIGGVLMFVLAGVAIWKMRKDEFWDEPPG
jgi:hypothetical protein